MTESANEHESLCMCGLCETKRNLDDSAAPAAPLAPNECHSAQEIAAIAYQVCGALNAPARILDYFSAIAQGEQATNPLPFAGPSVRPESRSDDTERKAFEAWVLSDKSPFGAFPDLDIDADGYTNRETWLSFQTWLARRAVTPGALWLCYHALKQIEWRSWDEWDNRICPCCEKMETEGHQKDCMVGNGLKAMAAVTRTEGK